MTDDLPTLCRVCQTMVPRRAIEDGTLDENGTGICHECI